MLVFKLNLNLQKKNKTNSNLKKIKLKKNNILEFWEFRRGEIWLWVGGVMGLYNSI